MEKEENFSEKLIEKLEKEMKTFKEEIKENGVDYAIDRSYELTAKQEMIDCLRYDVDLSEMQLQALLSRENLMDELYADWLKFDGNMREDIEFSIDKSLNLITGDYLKNVKSKKNYDR